MEWSIASEKRIEKTGYQVFGAEPTQTHWEASEVLFAWFFTMNLPNWVLIKTDKFLLILAYISYDKIKFIMLHIPKTQTEEKDNVKPCPIQPLRDLHHSIIHSIDHL